VDVVRCGARRKGHRGKKIEFRFTSVVFSPACVCVRGERTAKAPPYRRVPDLPRDKVWCVAERNLLRLSGNGHARVESFIIDQEKMDQVCLGPRPLHADHECRAASSSYVSAYAIAIM
jgi:hypothetical protein